MNSTALDSTHRSLVVNNLFRTIEKAKTNPHEKCHILVFVFVAGKILLFYLIFYAALAGFFGGLLAIFWQTLETEKPKWELSESIIGTNPGLGFRPMPPEANLGSTLVWYKANRPENMRYWHDTVDNFLAGK